MRFVFVLTITMSIWMSLTSFAHALCRGTPLNPVTDICWQCMFPIKIGSATMFDGGGSAGSPPPGIGVDEVACACAGPPPTLGITVAFWEHARLVETVKDPYCFPSMGTGMSSTGLNALAAGAQRSHASSDGQEFAFQQVHWIVLPIWTMLNLFTDFPCIEKLPYDIELSEVDPLWQDDAMSFFLNPEALLFGNPITQLSCMADSASAALGKPLDPLYWCLGSWGSSYPLSGSTTGSDPTTYNAQLAARMAFKLSRELLLSDTALEKCSPTGVISPILIKSHYRLQLAKPRRGTDCVPIGQASALWGAGKNPPLGAGKNAPDNFMWILTRSRVCCVGYSFE